jgi:hypothetical protein
MPFKLSKDELQIRTELIEDLILAGEEIDKSVSRYNRDVESLRSPVEASVSKFNEVLTKARELCSGIATEAEQDLGDKSEKWMESEKGIAAQAWQESWAEIVLDDVDYQWPDELEIDIPTYPDDLAGLPDEADES